MSNISRLHIIPEYTIGEHCKCGAPATHKVEEVVESLEVHPFTQYLCCQHFAEVFGSVASRSCGLTPLAPDAAKAEPYFDPELPEEYIEGVIYHQNRRAGKA